MVVEEGTRGNSVSIALERVERENLMVALSTPRDKREERKVANGVGRRGRLQMEWSILSFIMSWFIPQQ